MLQLCQAADVIILPVSLGLKIVNKKSKLYCSGSGIPELENRVKKPSYALWRHKTELSQIVTS